MREKKSKYETSANSSTFLYELVWNVFFFSRDKKWKLFQRVALNRKEKSRITSKDSSSSSYNKNSEINHSLALSKTYFSNRHTVVVKLKLILVWNLVFFFQVESLQLLNKLFFSLVRIGALAAHVSVYVWESDPWRSFNALLFWILAICCQNYFYFSFPKKFFKQLHTHAHEERERERAKYIFLIWVYLSICYNSFGNTKHPRSYHDTPFDAFDIAIEYKLPMQNEYETCKTVRKLNWGYILRACI